MNGKELKEYIIYNDRVIDILEEIGMHNIDKKVDYISCSFPDGDNPNGCLIYNSLYIRSHTREIENNKGYQPDIFDLVEFVINKPAIPYIMNYLGLSYSMNMREQSKPDGLDIYRKVAKKKNKRKSTNYLSEESLNRFQKECHISIVKDGILPQVALEWEVGLDYESERMTFVHRHWQSGRALAVVGRTIIQSYVELGIQKYMTILGKGYVKTENLYGLFKNRDTIDKTRQIIIVEGEKSVIKLWQYGYKNVVSLGCHSISLQQVAILTMLGLDEIVIAFDSDVNTSDILKECDKVSECCNKVSYIDVSKIKIYQDKCSPCDKGLKRWNLLFKNRKQFNKEDLGNVEE